MRKVEKASPEPATAPSAADYEDDVPTTLGQVLVEARAQAGLSVSEVAERTKVPPTFIEAVENNRYKDLPAHLYARGHLAKLCATYKIQAAPVMALYQDAVGAEAPAQQQAATPRPPAAGAISQGDSEVAPIQNVLQSSATAGGAGNRLATTVVLFALVLIAVLVVAGFALTQYRSWRMNREDNKLGVDPNATSDLEIEEFIPPQPLPLKEIPMPD
jgi:cytoskeletal protein RodZ